MKRTFLFSKIHLACVTAAKVDYEGSITIDKELMRAAGIAPYEKVLVANTANGNRFETYAITGGPGEIMLNGATAFLGKPGDRVIIFAFCQLDPGEQSAHKPVKVFVDGENRITRIE